MNFYLYNWSIKFFLSVIILFLNNSVLWANDAEYYTSGNQLVPLQNSSVRLDKEILTIKRIKEENRFHVEVYYNLFNERKATKTVIGFEAPGNFGDSEGDYFFFEPYDKHKLLNAEHKAIQKATGNYGNKNIEHFKVIVNGKTVPYKIASVSQIKKDKDTSPYIGSLYYFNVLLKKGSNIIKQSYDFYSQTSVNTYYELSYILQTAKRWKGGKIKDFTLNLIMGKNQIFTVDETFFAGTKHWKVENGMAVYIPPAKKKECYIDCGDSVRFYVKRGKVVFHQKNFIPNDVLFIESYTSNNNRVIFNYKTIKLPPYIGETYLCATDLTSMKILKAYPYAIRGVPFKDKDIKHYYKNLSWYKPKPNAKKHLTQDDKKWLSNIEKFKLIILRNLPFAKRGYVFGGIIIDGGYVQTKYGFYLQSFFEKQKWYKENSNYKASLKDLNHKEKNFRKKILSKKYISDEEFFKLMSNYPNIN